MGKRLVLLGAGHAHLHILHRAGRFTARGHQVVAVAPGPFWYSGLATGVLGGLYPPALDQVDVAALLAAGGGRFLQDEVVRVEPAARQVWLRGGGMVEYDVLSLNLGSLAPRIPGDEAPGVFAVKPVRRLWALRQALEARFAAAPAEPVRVVVAGGGATGFELAGNLVGLAARRGGRVAVTVLAAGEAVLRQLPPAAARLVEGRLAARGVQVRRGARVERIEPGRALLAGGGAEAFDYFLNATGLRPNPVLRACGLPVDEAGALRLDADLRSPADAAVHGGGDGVAVAGHELPRVGVYAIRQAPVLCHNLLAALEGGAPRRFRPQRRYLWIMNLGDGTGLAARGGWWWHGRSAHWLKDRIDRRFLGRFQGAAAGG